MTDQTVAKEIGGEVMEWAKKNPDELVILLLSHCKVGGDTAGDGDCDAPFFEPFKTLGIQVVENAEELKKMTVKQAEELAQIKEGGGKILAIYAKEDNVQSNYEEKIQFGGKFGSVIGNNCLSNCEKDAWDRLWDYCNSKLEATHDTMWQLQAIWQTPKWPIEETTKTGINRAIAERIFYTNSETQDKWNKLNFLLLNVVECEGPKISEKFGAKSKDQCFDPDYC